MSCVGTLRLHRRWWASRCACEAPGYGVDELLGLDGHYTKALQQHFSRLSADVSFAKADEHLQALLGVAVSKEAVRQACHRQGRRMASWQAAEECNAQSVCGGGW